MYRSILPRAFVALLSASSPVTNAFLASEKQFIQSSLKSSSAQSPSTAMSATKVIDSHLHVWATSSEASSGQFPYSGPEQTPPPQLQDVASPTALLEQMTKAGVDGALIVQPINHKFDHSYVANAMQLYPDRFKGMMLFDPSLSSPSLAVERLEELVLRGFVGVRFNPYLWPEGQGMSSSMSCDINGQVDGAGLAVYKRCGELKIPVGVMCFKGLGLHMDDIVTLISKSPETILILDHLGFCALNDKGEEEFGQLMSLAQYPNVIVKVSALFRNTGGVDEFPYNGVKRRRFDPLLEKFGAKRLMMGTDFPFVLETEGGYVGAVDIVKSWLPEGEDRDFVMGGTSEAVFGKWF